MAHVYVRSGAGGAGTGADWANAYTTLAAAFTAKAAGDNFWVSEDHAETQASAMTLTCPGTLASPCTAICVNHSGTVPPVSADLRTTATVTTTGANAINIYRTCEYYGITFSAGTGAVSSGITIGDGALAEFAIFKLCVLRKLGTSGDTAAIHLDSYIHIVFDNTSVDFGASGDGITVENGTIFRWRNTATPVVTTFPTTLVYDFRAAKIEFTGIDFSAAGFSGKTLFNASSNNNMCDHLLIGCKTHASLTLSNTPGATAAYEGGNLILIRSDGSGTNYRHEKKSYSGSQSVETGTVRTGGATDGTTPISWAIVTNANAEWILPFESLQMAIWNDTTASNVTVTVYGTWGGGAVPTNRDIWMEVSYMGSSGSPIATINTANAAADYLASATNQSSDGSTWGGGVTAFKMAVTLSSPQPALKGPIYVTLLAAKASDTFYICPKIVLT